MGGSTPPPGVPHAKDHLRGVPVLMNKAEVDELGVPILQRKDAITLTAARNEGFCGELFRGQALQETLEAGREGMPVGRTPHAYNDALHALAKEMHAKGIGLEGGEHQRRLGLLASADMRHSPMNPESEVFSVSK
ncbi:hypothetical protein AURANDRAFT_69528, partial [Aureococcus anophagefferens]